MPQVTFLHPDGTVTTVTVERGSSVMDAAVDHGVSGIQAQCGGGLTCATCHCYVLEPDVGTLPPPHADELEMLEYVWRRRPNSRLACQVRTSRAVTRVVVALPERQT